MFIDPLIGDSITVNGRTYMFTETPNAPGIVYAEIGRKAKVYRLLSNGDYFALKVFKPRYRSEAFVNNTNRIAQFKKVPGLAVADRFEISPSEHPDLIRKYNAFAHSVLMPWVDGKSWFNYVTGKVTITSAAVLQLARALVSTLLQLEQRNIAHCDLSSSNFIFSPDFLHVELIDIEDLFGYGLLEPAEKPRGTGGYAPEWVKSRGVWEASGDRFALGILVSEILGWQSEVIREASTGDAYFAEGEFGNKSKRFRLLSDHLETIHPELSRLFKTVWYAESLEECPRIADWKNVLDAIKDPILEVTPDYLTFSALDMKVRNPIYPQISLSIKNAGGRELKGHIKANVPWLDIQPSEFSCSEGARSQHFVILKANVPLEKRTQEYTFNNGISIQSNDGSKILSGSYKVLQNKSASPKWLFVTGVTAILLICLSVVLAFGLVNMGRGGMGPLALLATATQSPTRVFTSTASPPTEIPVEITPVPTIENSGIRLFITSNAGSGGICIVDLKSNTIVERIATGATAQGITGLPDGSRAYSADTASNQLSVLDTVNNVVVKKITVGNDPVIPVASHRGDRVYVTNIASDSISVIDTGTNALIDTITGVADPWGIAISPDDSQIAVALFLSNSISIYDTRTLERVANIKVGNLPEGLIYHPDGSKLYVANLSDSTVSVIDTFQNTVIQTIPVGIRKGNNPVQFAFNDSATQLFVANDVSGTVSEIEVSSGNVLRELTVGSGPRDVAIFYPYLYVTNSGSNTISVVDLNSGEVIKTITGCIAPHSIAP
jgi:YVTN family beta-propeller protein